MDKYQETFDTWNKLASLYRDKFMDLDLYNDTYDFVCNTVHKQNAKLLEIGCGPGNITNYLLTKRPDFEIFGIDIAPNMIVLAKQHNPTARFALMDIRKIDKINTKFDGIICGFCLPYLSLVDVQKLLIDCSHLLNKNGLIYLSFVEGDINKSGFKIGSTGDRIFFYYYNLDNLKPHFKKSKFIELEIYSADFKRSETETEKHIIWVGRKND